MINEREPKKPTRHSDDYVAKVTSGSQPFSAHHSPESHDHNTSIIFFGTDRYSLASLEKLVQAGHNIVAVVTKPDSKSGRGQEITPPIIKTFASRNGIEVWQPEKISDINDKIMAFETKPAGVLSSYGKIIPESTISLFNPGIINIHPSLLPKYRGPTPIESVIENGDTVTGVSVMQLVPKMDAGPTYAQFEYRLDNTETQVSLYETLADFGADKLLEVLPGILDGTTTPTQQNENQATYCKLLSKDSARLNPTEVSAEKAERLVRAHLIFPKTKIEINNHPVIVTKSHVADFAQSILDIQCQDGKFLSIDEVIAPSGRTISKQDYINGYA